MLSHNVSSYLGPCFIIINLLKESCLSSRASARARARAGARARARAGAGARASHCPGHCLGDKSLRIRIVSQDLIRIHDLHSGVSLACRTSCTLYRKLSLSSIRKEVEFPSTLFEAGLNLLPAKP